MNVLEKLKPFYDDIQEKLLNSVEESFPVSLKEPIRYFLDTPGKKVRPMFTLLSCQAVGGDWKSAVPVAVGIELFHDFTLIHDDIMDNDDMRRGCKTIHKVWDEGTAILVGDAMIGMAYDSIVKCEERHRSDVIHFFSEGLIKVCEGQALDKEFERRERASLEDYLDMISKKTAWLLKLSCHLGAILGNGSPAQIDALINFGKNLGIGFQIQDDLLDFVADEDKLGKKVGSDFRMDKKTYVTIKYHEHIRQHPEILSQYPEQIWQFESLEVLKNALFELGIVNETQAVVDAYFKQALDNLQKVQPLDDSNLIYQIVLLLQKRQS